MNRGELRIKNESLAVLDNYTISRGVPLPPGVVQGPEGVCVTDAAGKVVPSYGKVLQRRRDGSVEWMLLDILTNLGAQEEQKLYIEPRSAEQPSVDKPVTVQDDGATVTLSNGLSKVVLLKDGGSLIRRLVINGQTVIDGSTVTDLKTVDGGGKIYRASLSGPFKISVPHSNPLSATVRMEGTHTARDKTTFLDFALSFTLTAGSPDLKIDHTFYCRESREGKIPVKSIRLMLPTTMQGEATKLLRQAHHGHSWWPRPVEIHENIEVVASGVADIDNYNRSTAGPGVSHPCAGGSVFLRNLDSLHEDFSQVPFHMRPGGGSGFRADLQIAGLSGVYPYVGWKQEDFTLVTTFERFRQLHPKSIAIDEDQMIISIWPEWATPVQLVQGVSKTHTIWMTGEQRALTVDEVERHTLRWEVTSIDPVDISFDPAWPAYCEVLDCHELLRFQPAKYPLLENIVEPVPAAGNPNRYTYDRHPAIGMLNYGDIVSPDGATCHNNEDDINVFFPLQHYLRTGQTYAFDYGKEAARHYFEVDFCEWSTDPRQRGGLIPHTGSHFIGNVYSSHQWSEGVLAYYYLTGDERARNVVINVGDNHIYWIYNLTDVVCCDGREAGMPLVNLAAAYRVTGDEKYIKAAKHLIENFHLKYFREYGDLKYPYPQGAHEKLISGYGDWSSYAGLYRIWEVTGDEEVKELVVALLRKALKPENFNYNDIRAMDFFAAWILARLTGDEESVIKICERAAPMLLRRGGHPLRRMHYLKMLDDRGLIDDSKVGNRAGVI